MAPEDLGPRINELIEQSNIFDKTFSVEAALLLASTMVKNRKLSNTIAWGTVGYAATSRLWKKYKQHLESQKKEYVVKIAVDDPIFDLVSGWILRSTPEEEQYVVEAQRVFGRKSSPTKEAEDRLLDRLFGEGTSETARSEASEGYRNVGIEVDEDGPMSLEIEGFHYAVKFMRPGQDIIEEDDDDSYGGPKRYRGEPHFVVTCPSLEARRAFLQKVDRSFKSEDVRIPSVYRSSKWGEMQRVGDVPPRKLDTVILKQGQMQALVDDIQTFLDHEQAYVELDIPYHHGILLYGPPGTGKTSIAAAVSTALNLDVYAVQLSNLSDDSDLVDAFNAVRPRSVLLLEDIDTCAATRSETDGDIKGVTVGGLLQALDGFATPHGLITIMTTNHPDTLDERLVRAGRVDTSIEIDCVDTDQVVRLCQRFIGYVPDDLPELTPENMVSPAEVMGVFKTHLMDKENAGPALVKLLHQKLSDKNRTTPTNV